MSPHHLSHHLTHLRHAHTGFPSADPQAAAFGIAAALTCRCPAAQATVQALSQAIIAAGGCQCAGINGALAGVPEGCWVGVAALGSQTGVSDMLALKHAACGLVLGSQTCKQVDALLAPASFAALFGR